MKRFAMAITGLLAGALLTGPALGDQPDPGIGDVLEVVHHDWDGDGDRDRAMLVNDPGGYIDLHIYLTGLDEGADRTLAVRVRDFVWGGAMYGTHPRLEVTGRGALRVHSQNDSIGRNRWSQVLTVLWREGRFVVGGFTYEALDTLDLDFEYACDVNLMTGKGVFNGRSFRSQVRAKAVQDWGGLDTAPQPCPEG